MRIISGKYGRRRFSVPHTFRARPTTDFAKENLFNVLSNRIDFEDLDALDLFAGTGSISFELLSRECRQVTAVEKDNAHASFIAKVAKELKTDALQLIRGDVFRFLQHAAPGSYDFIFADPPYDLKELPEVVTLVFERDLLREGGIFVMEHPRQYDFSTLPYFDQHRIYGSVNFSIFMK
ncbi:16S rRNA (guanine(966)-N(2))-methyltransferase RsmD [Parabacteroides sp. 52]|uniref:16S rRNA (guanine(966)-N(2))-methyltransferase RsmD n=1 Tax=unclassified Parabacteroides TaxID=2649774 RepID=UPI0013D3D8C1|nr:MULTISPECIES: 16S rRNA (guanine(966)-N(2))-methyltransferase RsmD [unclassified Parabacteroides]MDH6535087.1 16S rRNA (guanine966-N2)-methyltransferase [Parabacteroides sp. PM5-20]NDV55513.1 16S rRNA (guanine(966)-N(2))-methyltransferase RsmD [Parabacteroides sp. 52]